MKNRKKKDDLEAYKNIRVANMNVEGMPGYIKKQEEDIHQQGCDPEGALLTPSETGKMIATALLAALLVAGVFLLLFFLLILFCVYVWFR